MSKGGSTDTADGRRKAGLCADRETDLISLVSTIRNHSDHTNVDPGPSSKNTARLKEDSEYFGNEGYH